MSLFPRAAENPIQRESSRQVGSTRLPPGPGAAFGATEHNPRNTDLTRLVRLLPHSPGKANLGTITMRKHVIGGRERVLRWGDLQRAVVGELDLYSTADLKIKRMIGAAARYGTLVSRLCVNERSELRLVRAEGELGTDNEVLLRHSNPVKRAVVVIGLAGQRDCVVEIELR